MFQKKTEATAPAAGARRHGPLTQITFSFGQVALAAFVLGALVAMAVMVG